MTKRRTILKGSTVLLVALATGCSNAPATNPAANPASLNGSSLISNNASGLISNTAGGLISNNAGGLISNNAGGLISNNAGGLISNNAGGLISNNAGGLISNNAGGLISNNAGGLTGVVRGPAAGLISNNAGGLISNNAGGLISNNAGGLVSNNAGGLISNNAGGLISNNAGGMRVLLADSGTDDLTEAVPNAKVACFNERGEMVSYSWVVTDENGNYNFNRLKASGPVVFVKAVYQREGKQVVLVSTAPAPRKAGLINCTVSPSTSIVAKKLGEMIQRRAVSASSVRAESIDKITQALAPVMTPKAVVAACILQQADVSSIFDSMLKESPALAARVGTAVASEGIASVVATTPAADNNTAGAAPVIAPDQVAVTPPATDTGSKPPASNPNTTPDTGNNATGSTPTTGGTSPAPSTAPSSAPAGNSALKGTIFTLGTVSTTPRVDMPTGSSTFTAALRTGVAGGAIGSLTAALTFAEDANNAAAAVAFDGATPYYLVGNTIVGNGKTTTITGFSETDATDLAVKGSSAYVTSAAQNAVFKVDLTSGTTSVFAGVASNVGIVADGSASEARFNAPTGICIVGSTLYVADTYSRRIRAIAADGTTSTLAGTGTGSVDGVGTGASFQGPTDVTADDKGNLYVADQNGNTVRKIVIADGTVTTIAGNGQQVSKDGTGANGSLFFPNTLAWGKSGGQDILVVSQVNHKIRLISGW
ncbi:MAG: hypothetical protein JWM80_6024 [Cyanobacteria bacterium RYN_339]|nr:hypothetical protein [Cyanobacteria bacterium RYN_339]